MEISALASFFGSALPSQTRPVESQSIYPHGSAAARTSRADHAPVPRVDRAAALRAFRYELRLALNTQFSAMLGKTQSPYAEYSGAATPDNVANEALGVARQVVSQSPTTAERSLLEFRARVEESASFVRQFVAAQPDAADVDQAVVRLDEGLAPMQREAAAMRVSSASILDMNLASKQRSEIRIRTQEGDVVKLSLKQVSTLSASASAQVDDDLTANSMQIEFASRSRMALKVRGDLNEAELAAIQGVIGQAQQIADAFFDGDVAAAFNSPQAFEFDGEQLAKVSMRFRMRQMFSASYAETISTRPALADNPTPVSAPVDAAAPAEPADTAVTAPVDAEPSGVEAPTADDAGGQDLAGPAQDALGGFFEMIGSFLRSVSEGFTAGIGNATLRYQYSESFKLGILQAVLHTAAPDDAENAAANAVEAIATLSDQDNQAGPEPGSDPG